MRSSGGLGHASPKVLFLAVVQILGRSVRRMLNDRQTCRALIRVCGDETSKIIAMTSVGRVGIGFRGFTDDRV